MFPCLSFLLSPKEKHHLNQFKQIIFGRGIQEWKIMSCLNKPTWIYTFFILNTYFSCLLKRISRKIESVVSFYLKKKHEIKIFRMLLKKFLIFNLLSAFLLIQGYYKYAFSNQSYLKHDLKFDASCLDQKSDDGRLPKFISVSNNNDNVGVIRI